MHSRSLLALTAAVALLACKKEPAAPATAPVVSVDAAGAGGGSGSGAAVAPSPSDAIRPFFYKADKDGRTTYLMGTMHLGIEPARIPPVVLAEVDRARRFAMEADVTDMSLVTEMMRKDGKTLRDDLGPEHWAKFEKLVGPGMAAGLQGMKPQVAATLLEVQGLPMTESMDLFLLNRARKAGAEVSYLEEARAQLALLDKLFDAAALKEMIDELAAGKNKNAALLPVYAAGDEDKMAAMIVDRSSWSSSSRSEAELEAQLEAMLYARNAAWIPGIEALHAAGGAFIAVGAAHLVGPRSVVDLLRGRGFTVTRVAP
jgi:hypothetical protein